MSSVNDNIFGGVHTAFSHNRLRTTICFLTLLPRPDRVSTFHPLRTLARSLEQAPWLRRHNFLAA